MAITYARYDTSAPVGATISQAAYHPDLGRALLNTAHASCNAATNAGSDTTKLTGGAFGGLDDANSALLWTALNSVKTLLDGDDAGGLALYMSSIYAGNPG